MESTEADNRLRAETAKLARLLADKPPEDGQGEFLTCEPEVYDGNVYPTYSARVALFPAAITVLEQDVVPAMEADGWVLRRRDSESYVAFDFDKDGFIVGATVPTGPRASGISVGGSGPCVKDDGTTGLIHDE